MTFVHTFQLFSMNDIDPDTLHDLTLYVALWLLQTISQYSCLMMQVLEYGFVADISIYLFINICYVALPHLIMIKYILNIEIFIKYIYDLYDMDIIKVYQKQSDYIHNPFTIQ